MTLFYAKYPFDPNDPRLSNITMKWKRYEYVKYTIVIYSITTSIKIGLLEGNVSVTYFMENFREKIYRYIKHSHLAQWQDLQFRQS